MLTEIFGFNSQPLSVQLQPIKAFRELHVDHEGKKMLSIQNQSWVI